MKSKTKLLMSVLVMTFLMAGFVSAGTLKGEVIYVGLPPQPETEDTPSLTECCFEDICKWVNYCDVEGVIEPETYIIEPAPVDLYAGEITENIIIEPTATIELITSGKGKQTFELGYDCYNQPGIPYWDCKQVEHKESWFIKKDFRVLGWYCSWDDPVWTCQRIWYRPAKA